MSTEYRFKKISDVGVIETANESAHVIIEDAGILKRMAAKNFSSSGSAGVSSWNDLTDKPFGDEVTTTHQYVDNAIVEVTEQQALLPFYFSIASNTTYDVTVNGSEYNCTSFNMKGANCIGNTAAIGGADSGEPFIFVDGDAIGQSGLMMGFFFELGTYTISISATVTEIAKLDSQYISTHGVDPCESVLCDGTFGFEEDGGVNFTTEPIALGVLEVGVPYDVVWDGTEYKNLVCFDDNGTPIIGATMDEIENGTANNVPFAIAYNETYILAATIDSGTEHSIKLTKTISIRKLDEKFIPNTIPRFKDLPELPMHRSVNGENILFNYDITGKELIPTGLTDFQSGETVDVYLYKITDSTEFYTYGHDGIDFTLIYSDGFETTRADYVKVLMKDKNGVQFYGYTEQQNALNPSLNACDVIGVYQAVETNWGFSLTPGMYAKCYKTGDTIVGYCKNVTLYRYSGKLSGLYLSDAYIKNPRFDYFYLKSSTPNSTKVFKITVDDNGTLSATTA